MKTLIALITATLLVSQHSARHPASPLRELGLDAQLCFFRYEDNGIINISDAKVGLSNYQTLTIEGGQAGCFYLMPGAYSFSVTSPNPYPGASRVKQWTSPRYKVALVSGERTVYQIFPNSSGATYTGGWRATLAEREPRLAPGAGHK
ncbi:MAG: hypothetical protein ACYDA9_05235 [Terriglobia bacterium]